MPEFTFDIPQPVIDQILRINKICSGDLARTGRVDLEEIATAVGRDPRSLINAIRNERLPFGWSVSEGKNNATLPVARTWAYLAGEALCIIQRLSLEDS